MTKTYLAIAFLITGFLVGDAYGEDRIADVYFDDGSVLHNAKFKPKDLSHGIIKVKHENEIFTLDFEDLKTIEFVVESGTQAYTAKVTLKIKTKTGAVINDRFSTADNGAKLRSNYFCYPRSFSFVNKLTGKEVTKSYGITNLGKKSYNECLFKKGETKAISSIVFKDDIEEKTEKGLTQPTNLPPQGVAQMPSDLPKKTTREQNQVYTTPMQEAGLAFASGDYQKAYALFMSEAKKGNPLAQGSLGMLHYKGYGVPKDYKEAIKWTRKAAEQGYLLAVYDMGVYYDKGHGIPQDYQMAIKWWTKAAEKNHPLAQFNLGLMYAKGKGVSIDPITAYKWANMAATNHFEDAKKLLNILKKQMTHAQITEAQRLSKELLKRIKDEGDLERFQTLVRQIPNDARAHNYLGNAYRALGRYKEAIASYKEAVRIDPNSRFPLTDLGRAYDELGQYQEAIASYKEATRISPDHGVAYILLGDAYAKLGQHKEAIASYKEYLSINPKNTAVRNLIKNLEQKTANEIEKKTEKRLTQPTNSPPQRVTQKMPSDLKKQTDAIKNDDNEFSHHAVQGLMRVFRPGKFKEYKRSFCGQYWMRIIRPNNIKGTSVVSLDQMKFDADTILSENPNLIELPTYGDGKLGSLNSIILFKKSTPLIGFNGFYIGLKCEDITSDGKPELFVDINDLGGMHTYIQYIFSMDKFNLLLGTRASGVTWYDGGLHQKMEDLDGDGVKEYNGWRSSFDLIGVCNACRQPPRVIMCLNDNEYVDCTKKFPELLQQDINESRKRLRSRTEYFKENIDALHTELIFQIVTSSNLNKEEETLDYIKTNFSKETVVRIMELKPMWNQEMPEAWPG
jgi:TPR repeat protein